MIDIGPHSSPHVSLSLRVITRSKLRKIASAKRWTMAEAADAVCDDFAGRNGIDLSDSLAPVPPAQADSQREPQSVPCSPASTQSSVTDSQAARQGGDGSTPKVNSEQGA